MAFQRPFLISLKRGDSQRWGFGITGGKEYGEPLRIQSVAEDSIAERCGLHDGDEVIQVGRINVQDMSQGQAYEVLARCGNKIEMFVVREDLFQQKKGKEPAVVKAVVHNPYNSPLSLYSTENVADTLAKQTEVLTEGQISTEEDEGPENLTFREKSAVFKVLEEQAKQENIQKGHSRGSTQSQVAKPKSAPPPPPKPKPPAEEHLHNGYDTSHYQHQVYQNQHQTGRTEYQTTQRVVKQEHYHQEQPIQYTQTSVYQTGSYQNTPGYQSPVAIERTYSPGHQSPGIYYQQRNQQQIYQQSNYQQGPQSPVRQYQQSNYQQVQGPQSPVSQNKHQQQIYHQVQGPQSPPVSHHKNQQQIYNQVQGPQSPVSQHRSQQQIYQQGSQSPAAGNYQQHPGYQSPVSATYQPLNQVNYQQTQNQQNRSRQEKPTSVYQPNQFQGVQQFEREQQPTAVSKAEFKIGPPPPPRGSSATKQQDTSKMAAVYKQQYEQHLQQQYEQQQQMQMNHVNGVGHKAHIIKDNIFENDETSVTPITYKAPPAAPPKPNWPPPESSDHFRSPAPPSPTNMKMGSVWPPKRSNATDLPKSGFNPAAVRETGTGRKCVWPPPSEEFRSGRNTPQSPVSGRKIQWNPSPSPPLNRRAVFGASQSPARRKDIQWPPPSPTNVNNKENFYQGSPRLSRRARFDDYIKEHASINVPQTYRPPPGTQHVEFY